MIYESSNRKQYKILYNDVIERPMTYQYNTSTKARMLLVLIYLFGTNSVGTRELICMCLHSYFCYRPRDLVFSASKERAKFNRLKFGERKGLLMKA